MAKMFCTVTEAAATLGVSEDDVKQFAREGKLREFRDGPRLMFKADQVEALKQELASQAGSAESAAEAAADPAAEAPVSSSQDLLSTKDACFLLPLFDRADLSKVTDGPLYLPLLEAILAKKEGAAPIASPTAQHQQCQALLDRMPEPALARLAKEVAEVLENFPGGISSAVLQSSCKEGREVTLRVLSRRRKASAEAVSRLAKSLSAIDLVSSMGVMIKGIELVHTPRPKITSLGDVLKHATGAAAQTLGLGLQVVELQMISSRLDPIIKKLEAFAESKKPS